MLMALMNTIVVIKITQGITVCRTKPLKLLNHMAFISLRGMVNFLKPLCYKIYWNDILLFQISKLMW